MKKLLNKTALPAVPHMSPITVAAKELGIGYSILRQWQNEGKILAVSYGKRYIINVNSVITCLKPEYRKEIQTKNALSTE